MRESQKYYYVRIDNTAYQTRRRYPPALELVKDDPDSKSVINAALEAAKSATEGIRWKNTTMRVNGVIKFRYSAQKSREQSEEELETRIRGLNAGVYFLDIITTGQLRIGFIFIAEKGGDYVMNRTQGKFFRDIVVNSQETLLLAQAKV